MFREQTTRRQILLAVLLAVVALLFAYAVYEAGHGFDESHSVDGQMEH